MTLKMPHNKNMKNTYVPDSEVTLLEAITSEGSVKKAAKKIGITPRTAYNLLYRMRQKKKQGLGYSNNLNNWREKSPLLKKVLTIKEKTDDDKIGVV